MEIVVIYKYLVAVHLFYVLPIARQWSGLRGIHLDLRTYVFSKDVNIRLGYYSSADGEFVMFPVQHWEIRELTSHFRLVPYPTATTFVVYTPCNRGRPAKVGGCIAAPDSVSLALSGLTGPIGGACPPRLQGQSILSEPDC